MSKTNLLVFIHPRILRSPDIGSRASGERYDTLRNLQLEFDNRNRDMSGPSGPSGPLLPERPVSKRDAP